MDDRLVEAARSSIRDVLRRGNVPAAGPSSHGDFDEKLVALLHAVAKRAREGDAGLRRPSIETGQSVSDVEELMPPPREWRFNRLVHAAIRAIEASAPAALRVAPALPAVLIAALLAGGPSVATGSPALLGDVLGRVTQPGTWAQGTPPEHDAPAPLAADGAMEDSPGEPADGSWASWLDAAAAQPAGVESSDEAAPSLGSQSWDTAAQDGAGWDDGTGSSQPVAGDGTDDHPGLGREHAPGQNGQPDRQGPPSHAGQGGGNAGASDKPGGGPPSTPPGHSR